MHLLRLEEATSTNDVCARLGLEGATSGVAVLAKRQTAGRGRLGRAWATLPGDNVLLSVLHRSRLPATQLAGLTLDVGLAIASVIEHLGFRADLKWPNDVLIDGRKVAGILCELHEDPAGGYFVVVGLGLDVLADALPPELATIATSLLLERRRAGSGEPLDCDSVAEACIDAVRAACSRYEDRGAPDVEAWLARSRLVGTRLRASVDGRVGVVTGLAPDGAIMLLWDGATRSEPFLAGELTPVPVAPQGGPA